MNSRQMNSSFSFERVILLCKRYLAIKQNMILIGVSAMMGLLVLTYVGMIYFDPVNLQLTGSINVMTFAFISNIICIRTRIQYSICFTPKLSILCF